MKQYQDLTQQQKALFDMIENFFIHHKSIERDDFCTVLGVLINKYKFKKN
jgi:hypothetical protein